jgi:excinuclease UvrABC nuclease subunit
LLKQFGGLKGVQLAGLEDLAAVQGICPHLAHVIYDHLHAGN